MLTDLDELVLTVRDPDSRTYIREAMIAYRGGANRAAVVSVWVAVIYDIISKLRLLDSQGDKAAQLLIQDLDRAIANNDFKAMANFEDRLLDEALNTFEFLSRVECHDFNRMRLDRNRCAHPAFGGEMLLYNPSPEAVRAHIVHAITHLLSRPPVQGKAAIDKIVADIAGPYFPIDQEEVNSYLCSRYLDHAKPSLVANLVAVLVKALLRRDHPTLTGHEGSALTALTAIASRHPEMFKTKMQDLMRKASHDVEDKDVSYLLELVGTQPGLWGMLDESVHIKCRRLVESCSPETTSDGAFLAALSIEPLREALTYRLYELEDSDLVTILERFRRPELSEFAVSRFVKSRSFRSAEANARLALRRFAIFLTPTQIRQALQAVPENNQIWDAGDMPTILAGFFRTSQRHLDFLKPDWIEMMRGVIANEHRMRTSLEIQRRWDGLIQSMYTAGLGPFEWPSDDADDERNE